MKLYILDVLARNLSKNINNTATTINTIASRNIPKFNIKLDDLIPTFERFESGEVELSSLILNIFLYKSVGSKTSKLAIVRNMFRNIYALDGNNKLNEGRVIMIYKALIMPHS
jgi:hypothetical protein